MTDPRTPGGRAPFDEVAESYHRFRPRPPEVLVSLLTSYARCASPPRVVDLGCGTGLSTRMWAESAREVTGIDPSEGMLAEARRRAGAPNVRYLCADAAATGLDAGSADVVVAVQSFHWMHPARTLAEIGRILRPGGVFAAVDTRFPPAIDAELDAAFERFLFRAQERIGDGDRTPRWNKEGHLQRMVDSGVFRHVREAQLHAVGRGGADDLVGFAWSAVDGPRLRALGARDEDLELDVLRDAARRVLGAREVDWIFGYRARLAVK